MNSSGRLVRAFLWAAAVCLVPACGGSSGGPVVPPGGPADVSLPVITLGAPVTGGVYDAATTPVVLSGTALDETGLQEVRWSNDPAGGKGLASGTGSWTATVWLNPGPNHVTLTAVDSSGNERSTTVTVLLRLSNLVSWGFNFDGQLADGTRVNRTRAVEVPNLPGVKEAAAGLGHTVILRNDGSVWTAGSDAFGQLGDGTASPTPVVVPAQVPALGDIVQVAAGQHHSVALRADGTVWCFGRDQLGQLGNGAAAGAPAPVQVATNAPGTVPLANVVAVAAGQDHTLALTASGQLYAWGQNASGQLGVGAAPAFSPFALPVALPLVKSMSAGADFSIALLADATVRTWGSNAFGQLGVDPVVTPSRNTPGAAPLLPLISVAAGPHHVAGLLSTGALLVWGRNQQGQLGNGTTVDAFSTIPVVLANFTFATQVVAGDGWTMALAATGDVYSWGANSLGQLGDGTREQRLTPTSIGGSGLIRSIHGGYGHALAVRCDSPLQSWGSNNSGQLGDENTSFRTTPQPVPGMADVTAVAAGQVHVLALLEDGTLRAWGKNDSGQLGDNTLVDRSSPVTVLDALGAAPLGSGAFPVIDIAAGQQHSLALLSDGTVYAWGSDFFGGAIGNGPPDAGAFPLPVAVALPRPAVDVSAGGASSYAVLDDGTVACWGSNGFGNLGDGTNVFKPAPVFVVATGGGPPLAGVAEVQCGGSSSIARMQDGTVRCFGLGTSGQMGNGVNGNSFVPVTPTGLAGVTQISAGQSHFLAIAGGQLYAWGGGFNGELGIGPATFRNLPTLVAAIGDATRIEGGGPFSLALRSDQSVFAWGNNDSGQLGDRSTGDATAPVEVFGVAGAVEMTAGQDFSIALISDGTLRAWGNNRQGQLGDGNTVFSTTPRVVRSLSNVQRVSAGSEHTLALLAGGLLRAWGSSGTSRLGDGSGEDQYTPVPVPGHPSGPLVQQLRSVAAGDQHSVVLKADGTLMAWGEGGSGQLGDGSGGEKETAVVAPYAGSKLVEVVAGGEYSAGLAADGTVLGWGINDAGQYGNGGTVQQDTPQPTLFSGFKQISAGSGNLVRLRADGVVYVSGFNYAGQLGNGTINVPANSPTPLAVPGLANVKAVAAGGSFCTALRADGLVFAWGANADGQLGVGNTTDSATPAAVETAPGVPLDRVIAISAGFSHGLALRADGTVWAWGQNDLFGQVGDGTLVDRTRAVQVPGVTGIGDVAAGGNFSLVRR